MPLRISRDRVAIYGAALFAIGLWQLVRNTVRDPNFADWAFFWTGGATAGTRALLDPQLHLAFERAHGLQAGIWPYLPAFAWLYVPASRLPIAAGYAISAVAMLGIAAVAGALLADAFAMPRWFGVVATLAWAPVKVAAFGGQNTPLALLLIAMAIAAARRCSPWQLGLAVGLLFYKPSIAAPFVVILLVRREWRAWPSLPAAPSFGICLACPLRAATGRGRVCTPRPSARTTRPISVSNAANAVSLPGVLIRFGVSAAVAAGVGAAAFVVCLPRLARVDAVAALSVTSALAVAVSPHAWHYEPVILLPAIFYAMRSVRQPMLTWAIVAAYVVADVSIFDIRLADVERARGGRLFWTVLVVLVGGCRIASCAREA